MALVQFLLLALCLQERFRAIYETCYILYISHCQIALHYHLSMVCTYMSKEVVMFVAADKMLKDTHTDLSLKVQFLSFSNLKFNFKCWVLLFMKIFPPFGFPPPKFLFQVPLPFLKSSKFGFY